MDDLDDTYYDLTFPVPKERERQTHAQRWWIHKQRELTIEQYIEGDWLLNGEVSIFCEDGSVFSCTTAELRFGKHPYMQSCEPLCLAADFDGDDKHVFEHLRADDTSRTLCGSVGGCTAVFYPYPFQMSRLRRLLGAMYNRPADSDRGLCALMGSCMRYYRDLLQHASEAEDAAAPKKRNKT